MAEVGQVAARISETLRELGDQVADASRTQSASASLAVGKIWEIDGELDAAEEFVAQQQREGGGVCQTRPHTGQERQPERRYPHGIEIVVVAPRSDVRVAAPAAPG